MKKFLFLLLFAQQFTCSALTYTKPIVDSLSKLPTVTNTTLTNKVTKERNFEIFSIIGLIVAAIGLILAIVMPSEKQSLFDAKSIILLPIGFVSFILATIGEIRISRKKIKYLGRRLMLATIALLLAIIWFNRN